MRLAHLTLVAAVLLAHHSADVFVTGDTPKPSDTNNLPATPAPAANSNNGQTPAPSASTTAPGQTPVPAQGQTPAPTTKQPTPSPTPSPSPSPTPSVAAATTNNNATATPVPSVSSESNSSSSKDRAATSTSAGSSASSASASTPEATSGSKSTPVSNQTADENDSGGMSAGAIVGIILAVLAFVGIAGFFLYRHLRARADEHEGGKHFDYPVGGSPQEVTVMGSGQHGQSSDYSLSKMERQSSQDMPIMAGGGSILSSLNNSSYAGGSSLQSAYNSNQNAIGGFGNNYGNPNTASSNASATQGNHNSSNANYGNSNNVTLYSEGSSESSSVPAFAKSTARFLSGPDAESPPFKKTDVQLSRPSTSNLDEPMEFNHSFKHSFAESYAESYSESYSDGGGYMNSFVAGMPGSEGLSVGRESSAMGDALDRDTSTGNAANDNGHWLDAMDEMRDTGDSYAMLESDAYGSERGSAIDDRFSTDSDYAGPSPGGFKL